MPQGASAVSVVIPAYNAEKTIGAAIDSAWAQIPPPTEIVVGDDGSSDRTADIAEATRARVLRLPRGNGAIARNRAAEAASGDVLFFLDADDLWLPGKIARHLEVFESQPDMPLVMDRAQPFREDGNAVRWIGGRADEGPITWRELIDHRNWPSGSGFSVRRDAYWKVVGFNESLTKFQDVDFWIRCLAANGAAWNLAEVLTSYRITPGSVSKSTKNHDANLEAMLAGWPFADNQDKGRMRRIANLMIAESSRWPEALHFLARAGWPVTMRFFWKCAYVSFRRTILSARIN